MKNVASWMRPFIGTVSTVLLLAGCLGVPAPEDGELRFHNWWNYYERGAAQLLDGEVEGARADFERCLGLRPGSKYGYARDKWRVRTYGVHVLEGYYPNRELGICLFLLGDTAGAERYLGRSLQQQPSGRAKHYMNRVRRARLEAARVAPPRIVPDAPPGEWITPARFLVFSGRAEAEGYVRDLLINGRPEFIELAEPSVAFARDLPLREGLNELRVEARDLLGRAAARTVRVRADWRGPDLLVRSLTREGAGWRVRGVCRDDDRIESATLWLNSHSATLLTPAGPRAQLDLDVLVPDGRPAWFEARDRAGHALRVDLAHTVRTLRESAALRTASALPLLFAQDEPDAEDRVRPVILVNGPLVAAVQQDSWHLDGQVDDRGGLARVTLNDLDLLPAGERGALSYAFSQRLPLAPGENRFELAAVDRRGNRSVKKLVFTRQTPPALDRTYRLSLGLPSPIGEEGLKDMVGERLYAGFQEEPVRFNVVADPSAWKTVPGGAESAAMDLAPYLDAARRLRAELLVVSSVVREGAGRSIYARLLDSRDGEMLFVDDVYSEAIEDDLAWHIAGLVNKIERRFPMFQGGIVKATRSQYTIDRGAQDGVCVRTRLIVAAPGAEGEEAGAVRMAGGEAVELRVVRAARDRGVAEPTGSGAREVVKEGDIVFAR